MIDGPPDRPLGHAERINLLGRIVVIAVALVVVVAVFHGPWWALAVFAVLAALMALAVWAEWKAVR